MFRGKFLDYLKQAYCCGNLVFKGKSMDIAGKKKFAAFIHKLYNMEWVANIQKPLGNPAKILEYLSRYVFRIAITDRRILAVKDGKVLFSWKDYRTGLYRKMELGVNEFIRRFLLHLLPPGFFKVRYYGIFSSRYRKQNIETAKALIQQDIDLGNEQISEDYGRAWVKQDTIWDKIFHMIIGHKQPNCPVCKKGRMAFAGIVRHDQVPPG